VKSLFYDLKSIKIYKYYYVFARRKPIHSFGFWCWIIEHSFWLWGRDESHHYIIFGKGLIRIYCKWKTALSGNSQNKPLYRTRFKTFNLL